MSVRPTIFIPIISIRLIFFHTHANSRNTFFTKIQYIILGGKISHLTNDLHVFIKVTFRPLKLLHLCTKKLGKK